MVEMAKNLYKKLSDIKCPQVNKFSSSSFDWLFDDDDSQTFLEWFCNSVDSETNLTSTAELERYKALKDEGFTVLEEKRLHEALVNQPKTNIVKKAELVSEIENLNREKECLLEKRKGYLNQMNSLSLKTEEVKESIGYSITEKLSERLRLQIESLNESKVNLQQSIGKAKNSSTDFKLLSNTSLGRFIDKENEYTRLLTNYASSQFMQNEGLMGQNSGSDICAMVKIEDPNLCDILGLNLNARAVQNWELKNFENRLPLVEEDKISKEIHLAIIESAITFYHNFIFQFVPAESSLNTDELERKIASYSKEVVLLKSTITNLFLQSTRLRCDSVLVGDCNLKLMRQNYFMAKQKHLFLLLSEQWAREQLILLALRFEGHKLESLLTHLKNVDQRLSLWNNYCKLLPIVETEKSLRDRNTIHFNDRISRSLLVTLGSAMCSKKVTSSYNEISESSKDFQKEYRENSESFFRLQDFFVNHGRDLEKIVAAMADLLFSAPLTQVTQALSRSNKMEEGLLKLTNIRDNVQGRLKPLHRDFKSKQLVIKNDQFAILERRLWSLFYTDTNTMQRKTEALNAKAATY